MKLWGGRFEAGPSEVFERFSGSLHFDKRLVDADIRGSMAYARALERVGILTAQERDDLAAAFDGDSERLARRRRSWHGADDEDVHTLVIRKLKERAGALADKIHTGRSRNDQVSLDVRLWLREEIDASVKELLGLDVGAARYGAARSAGDCAGLYAYAARAAGVVAALFAGVFRDVRARSGAVEGNARRAWM